MTAGNQSQKWYIENIKTRYRVFLNVGSFSIGRRNGNDLRISTKADLNGKEYCSKVHCILNLHEGRVRLKNMSKFGTFVNHLKVDEIELCVGDKISLVDILALLPHMRGEVSQLSFKVGHSFESAAEMVSVPLVSVSTRPEPSDVIVIDSSDDENDGEINKFADDYEMGEPSNKNMEKRVSEPIIPVSKNLPAEPLKSAPGSAPTSPVAASVSATKVFRKSPYPSKRRIAHKPKEKHEAAAIAPKQSTGITKRRPSNTQTTTVFGPTEAKRPMYDLDVYLTPPLAGPAEETDEIIIDHTSALVKTIVNWNTIKIMERSDAHQPFQRTMQPVPKDRFEDIAHHERIQTGLLKCHLWHRLHGYFRPLEQKEHLNIKKTIASPDGLILECNASRKLQISNGDVVFIEAIVCGSKEIKFLGYVTEGTHNDDQNSFKLEVSIEHKDTLKISTKAAIFARENIGIYIQFYKAIFDARRSSLFEAIIDPSKLRRISAKSIYRLDRSKCVNPLNEVQFGVLGTIFSNTTEALIRGNAFSTVVNGGPGTGKSSIIIELINALVRSDVYKKRTDLKILVVGSSDEVVDSLANRLHIHRTLNTGGDMYAKLKFMRYGTIVNTTYSNVKSYTPQEQAKIPPNEPNMKQRYDRIIKTSRIVFAPINISHNLTRYSDKFDVILFDNASETDEIISTLLLLFSPTALIMFGDQYRKPKDSRKLTKKYAHCNLNQSMFLRLFNAGHCVFNLDHTFRFSKPILQFLNNCFYQNSLQPIFGLQDGPMASFGLIHREHDSFMFKVLTCFMEVISPINHKYSIILPADMPPHTLDEVLGAHKPRVMLSSNTNFTNDEKDVLIIWVNKSMHNIDRYQIDNLLPALTRTKKAIFFFGCTEVFQRDSNWVKIYEYARAVQRAMDLNYVNDITSYQVRKFISN